MPLPKLRGGSGHQTSRRDITKRENLANKISLRIKNSGQAGLKMHFKVILKKLRN
jgi:hypothetical protein